jgi:hypothetical protein
MGKTHVPQHSLIIGWSSPILEGSYLLYVLKPPEKKQNMLSLLADYLWPTMLKDVLQEVPKGDK